MHAFFTSLLHWAELAAVVTWLAKSVKIIGPSQVGIYLIFGKQMFVCRTGPWFVPWIPVTFSGLHPFELVRRSKGIITFDYDGKEGGPGEEQVWSSDHQQLFVQISGFVRIPYNEPDSLMQMVENNVPADSAKLAQWVKEEVVAGVRNFMSQYTMEHAIAKPNLVQINDAAKTFFLRPEGLFAKSGICGNNPTNFTPGTGEVVLRIDQILPTKKVRDAMGNPAVAKYDAEAAKSEAKQEAIKAGVIDIKMDEWIKKQAKRTGKTVAEATTAAMADGSWDRQQRLYKDFIFAGNDDLEVMRYEIGAPDGTAIDGNLPGAAAFAAILRGGGKGGGQGNRGGKGGRGKKPQDMDDDEAEGRAMGAD